MKVQLIARTQLQSSKEIRESLNLPLESQVTDGELISLTAIRNCYSPNHPTEIIPKEYDKYFNRKAKDGKKSNDAERLFRQIVHSKHTDTMEYLEFVFAIEGISRACLSQLTRHRIGWSFSVKGQRYVSYNSNSRHGSASFYVSDQVKQNPEVYKKHMQFLKLAQEQYDFERSHGIAQENARDVLPISALCDLVAGCNFRAFLDFYSKRQPGKGAQKEISKLAKLMKDSIVRAEPWTGQFFEGTK